MKHTSSILIGCAALLVSSAVLAQVPPPPPPPPPTGIDEYNVLVLVDVTGSMAEQHTASLTKMAQARIQAKDEVLRIKALATSAGKPEPEYALWAFDTGFAAPSYVNHILDFPATATQVLAQLGFDASGNAITTHNAALEPSNATPLAAAGCFAAGTLVANLDMSGNILDSQGYEWNKNITVAGGTTRRANISRHFVLITDGLENSTPSTNECYGTTSTLDYANYETGSWQYKLRSKLLTGNPSSVYTANSGLVVDVDLIFKNFVTGLSAGGYETTAYGGGMSSYTTSPTLSQALTFFKGMATVSTKGVFKTVTVAADGTVATRIPGDVDYSGCVGNADYTELVQWYGQQVSATHPHSYWADLNGDGWVDYADYTILVANWGTGGVC
jgi:hypothetical protein